MTSFDLKLRVPASIPSSSARATFYWSAQGLCSFESTYGPRLGGLGPVIPLNVDFARVAVAAFAADRTTSRVGGGSNWNRRDIEIAVPVSDPARWETVADEIAALLGFLTGDTWAVRFKRSRVPREPVAERQSPCSRVVLLSGGADSAVGALVSRSVLGQDESHALVSHVGAKNTRPVQSEVASEVERLIPGPSQRHLQVGFRRRGQQPDGTPFVDEFSTRSRSLLYIAFGLAVASIDLAPLWMPENGFASLNPPLGPERRGSLSTRTTHPAFLSQLGSILASVGAHSDITNPFADQTKGEMFRKAADLVGAKNASALLSATQSCAHTGQRAFGIPTGTQCGVCFGCLVRKAAFLAAGLKDDTPYIARGTSPRVDRWLSGKSAETALRDFLRREVRSCDIATMSLPPDYTAGRAMDLCHRACEELRGLSL